MVTPIIETVDATGSTNADMARRAGALEGHWLRAVTQTGGRGRAGRIWVSPPGNLYTSTLVRPRPGDPPTPSLALVTALAVHDAVAALVDPARLAIKWPNDLLLDGAKLSGVLLAGAGDAVVVGVGVNVAHAPQVPDRATMALHAAGVDARIDAEALLTDLTTAFAARLGQWRGDGLAAIITDWLACALPIGTAMAAQDAAGNPVTGSFGGLAADGALLLRLADGRAMAIHAGDVEPVVG